MQLVHAGRPAGCRGKSVENVNFLKGTYLDIFSILFGISKWNSVRKSDERTKHILPIHHIAVLCQSSGANQTPGLHCKRMLVNFR